MATNTSSGRDPETGSEKTVAGEVGEQEQQQLEQQASHRDKQADVPPNGGYGWVCVVCVGLINMHTWGLNSVSLTVMAVDISNSSGADRCHGLALICSTVLWCFSIILCAK